MISATNGKTTTAAMVARILERDGRAPRPQPRRGEHGRRRRHRRLLEGDGDTRPLRGRRVLAGPGRRRSSSPRALLLANLFRDQLDRYGELETIADRWAAVVGGAPRRALVLNADDPLVADLGRDRADVTYFGVEDDALAHGRDAARGRLQALPPLRRALRLRRDLPRATSATTTARPATRGGPSPRSAPRDVALDGIRAAAFTLHTPAGERARRAPAARPLQRLQRAGGGGRWRWRSAPRSTTSSPGLEAVAPAFGRAETVALAGRELAILLVKNPAGANEVLRTLVLEPGEHDLLGVLNDHIADGRDVSWIWDADFEVLAGRVRRVTCAGTRAAELAVRLKYAGVPVERIAVEPRARGRRWTEPPRTARGRLYAAAHLHRDARAARAARRAAASPAGRSCDRRAQRRLARHRVRRLRRRPAAVARARRRRPAGRCSTSAPAPGRVALDLAGRGHEVVALDTDAALLAALRDRADGLRGADRRSPTPATSTSAGRFAARSWLRCRRCSCSAAATRDFLRCAAARIWRRAGCWRRRSPIARGRTRATSGPLPDMRERDGWVWSSQPVAIRARARRRGRSSASARPSRPTASARSPATRSVLAAHRPRTSSRPPAARAGLRVRCRAALIAETADYVGSEVVVLGA